MTNKTLKDFFEVYKPKAPDEQKFVDKHVTIKHKDRNGNGDDVFNGNTKYIKRKEERHGYDVGEDEKVYEEVEDLEEGTMKLSKVHIVHHHDHPAAKEFAKHYTDAMKGDHREGGPTEKDEAASNKFHERYTGVRTREGFAGSGTHVYTDHKTGAKWKVDRHPNGKTFYGTDHIISHHTGPIHEGLEEGEYLDTSAEDRVLRSLVAYYEELGEDVLIEDVASLAEELIDELSTGTLRKYREKARDDADDAYAVDDDRRLRKRSAGSYAAGKKILKRGDTLRKEEVDSDLEDELKKQRQTKKSVGGKWKSVSYKTSDGKWATKDVKEEVESIDELSKSTLGSYVKKASPSASAALATAVSSTNPDSVKSAGKKFSKRSIGIDRAVNKLTKEDVINRAIEKYVPEDVELPSMEERLVAKLDGLAESHIHMLLSLFEGLTEDNQRKMLDTVETTQGINSLIDFAIKNRGE